MINVSIVRHLQSNNIPFSHHWHARAVDAQGVAHALHVSGQRLAKSVIVEADGDRYIAVLPANRRVDLQSFAQAVGADRARLVSESEFAPLFRDCEPGAEPPFGRLYNLPVVLDASFRSDRRMIVRGGSHEETIELAYDDFIRLEEPTIANIGFGPTTTETTEPQPTMH